MADWNYEVGEINGLHGNDAIPENLYGFFTVKIPI
jgi:hypothetical protein